jgi:purine-binding chemotaxis protein CheW
MTKISLFQEKLLERARQLAKPHRGQDEGEKLKMLVLQLGLEEYGVLIDYVEEIRPLSQLTPIPGTPSFWAGLVNLRGHLYPVLELADYLELPISINLNSAKIVLVNASGLKVALLVDDVLEIRRILPTEIGPTLQNSGAAQDGIIRGLTASLLSVLDLEVLLLDPRLVVQEKIA